MTADSLRVASYNLLHGLHLSRRGVVDLPAAAAVMADLGADVIAVQEVDRDQRRSGHVDQIAELGGLLDMAAVFCPALRGDPEASWEPVGHDDGGPGYGVGLLSRLPLVGHARIDLPGGGAGHRGPHASLRNPGWDREPRVALSAGVLLGDRRLTMTVTHLSYLPLRAMRQLRAAARRIAPAHPRVLVGDLNLPPRIVRAVLPDWHHAGGRATYPAWRPRVQMHHVMVDGRLDVLAAAVHVETTSDHRPLVVDLRVIS